MTDDMTPILDRIKKVYQYSIRGTGGEKENAQKILDALLKKHKVTIEQILEPDRKRFMIPTKGALDLELLYACIFYVVQAREIMCHAYPKHLYVELTQSEYIDVKECFKFHRKGMLREEKALLKAYIIANKLFTNSPLTDAEIAKIKARTKEEQAEIERLHAMAKSVQDKRWDGRRKLEAAAESLRS